MTDSEYKALMDAAEKIASMDLSALFEALKEKAIVWKGRCNGS